MGHGASELQKLRAGVEALQARLTAVEQELKALTRRLGALEGSAAATGGREAEPAKRTRGSEPAGVPRAPARKRG